MSRSSHGVPAGLALWCALVALAGATATPPARAAEGGAKDPEAERVEQEIAQLQRELTEIESNIQQLTSKAQQTRKELAQLDSELKKLKSQPEKDATAKAKMDELTEKAKTARETLTRIESQAEKARKLAGEKREAKRKAEIMARKLSQEESKRKRSVTAAKRRAPSTTVSGTAAAAPSGTAAAKMTDEELMRAEAVRAAGLRMPGDLPLTYVWSLSLKGSVAPGDIWAHRDIVLLLVNEKVLYCIRKQDGVPLWAVELADRPQFPPAASERAVYVIVQNRLMAIDRAAGQVVWAITPEFAPSGRPCVSEPNLYIPGWDKRVHAVEVVSRERVYVAGSEREEALKGREYTLRKSWHKTTGGHIVATPALDEGFLFFGSEDGYVYSVSVDGEERYKTQTQGPIRSPVTVKGGQVYVGSADFNAYAFDRLTGQLRWAFPTGSDVFQPICSDPAAGVAIVCSNKNGVFGVLDKPVPERGSQLWYIPDGEFIAGVSPELVYLALTDRRLAAVEKKTGMVRWISLLDGVEQVIPCVNDWTRPDDPMRLLYISTGGSLVCLREPQEALRRALEERK